MNFRTREHDEPEINLIAFIDVLLVILIFLMLSTTYSRYTQMQLTLPVADAESQREYPKTLHVAVGADGSYSINQLGVRGRSVEELAHALQSSAENRKDMVVVISADASARHQSVISLMEAARRAGLYQITFATQSSNAGQP